MKFIDTLTEEDKKKLIKKAKLIFSIFKKGTITRRDGVSFSYELKDNMVPRVVKGEVEISAFITEIIEKTYCPINEHAMKDLIVKKFNHFNINAEIYYTSNSHVEKYKGKKPWEEQTELNEDARSFKKEDSSEEKRVKTIFKAFKKGVIKVQHPKTNEIINFRYHINDNVFYKWEYHNMMEKQLTIITNNLPGKGITISCDDENIVDKCTNDVESMSRNPTGIHLREMFVNKLKNKFDKFEAKIYVNVNGMKFILDEPKEPINESKEDNEKLIKKVKTIYKAIKNGVIRKGHFGNITYELPYEYDVQIDVNDEAFVKVGRNGSNNDIRFFHVDGTSGKVQPYSLTNKEYDVFVRAIERHKFKPFNIVLWYEQSEDTVQPINESKEDRLIKKGKLIFKLYNKGIIGSKDKPDEPRFSYELSDDTSVGTLGDGYIVIFTDKVKIMELNRACRHTSVLFMGSLIQKRFEQFGITLSYPHIDKEDVDTHLERERPLNENHDENKLLKKGKAVYTVLKSGKINYQRDEDNERARLTYTLSDERNIFISEEGGIWITPKKIKVREENKECLKISAGRVQDLIKEKFERFNISLNLRNFNPREDWDTWLDREGLNEEEEENNITEKDRKKVKLIYDLFKTGRYTDDDMKYEYVLPDEYYVSIDDETGIPVVILTMDPTQTLDLYMVLTNTYIPKVDKEYNNLYKDVKRRIKEKFNNFNIDIVF